MEANAVSVHHYCVGDELIEMVCTVLTLLSPLRRPYRSASLSPQFHPRCESESGSESSTSAPTTPTEAHATLQSLLYRGVESREKMPNNIVYIDLLRPGSSIDDNDPSWISPSQLAEERSLVERGYRIVRATNHPRHLRDIDPTITFLSHSFSNARSYFTVHLGDRLMFSESTTLELVDPSTSNVDGILYKTLLVPGFWDTICRSPGMSIEFPAEFIILIYSRRCFAIYHHSTRGSRPLFFLLSTLHNLLRSIQVPLPNIHTNSRKFRHLAHVSAGTPRAERRVLFRKPAIDGRRRVLRHDGFR